MPSTPPLRSRDEMSVAATLCLVFGLARSEGQMLAELLTSDFCTRPQLFVAANRDNPKVALDSIKTILSFMRKKLARRHVKISALPNLGYGLNKQSRDRINQLLAEFDAGFLPPKSQAAPSKRHVTRIGQQTLPAE